VTECNCKNEDSLAMAQNKAVFILEKAGHFPVF
jgi:hypothetical protein